MADAVTGMNLILMVGALQIFLLGLYARNAIVYQNAEYKKVLELLGVCLFRRNRRYQSLTCINTFEIMLREKPCSSLPPIARSCNLSFM